jgi:hypothetical protein
MTFPKEDIRINRDKITSLKSFLRGFDLNIIENNYSFIYENIEIIVSKNGAVLISLIISPKSDVSDNLTKLAKIASKINTSIKIESFSTKINIYESGKSMGSVNQCS